VSYLPPQMRYLGCEDQVQHQRNAYQNLGAWKNLLSDHD
jgi:hypothetical protein